MNVWLVAAAVLALEVPVLLLRSWLGRHGYGLSVAVIVKRPRKNPRLPTPKPGNIIVPLQMTRANEKMLWEGVVGIVKMEPVGDGTVTLLVEQTNPQGS